MLGFNQENPNFRIKFRTFGKCDLKFTSIDEFYPPCWKLVCRWLKHRKTETMPTIIISHHNICGSLSIFNIIYNNKRRKNDWKFWIRWYFYLKLRRQHLMEFFLVKKVERLKFSKFIVHNGNWCDFLENPLVLSKIRSRDENA